MVVIPVVGGAAPPARRPILFIVGKASGGFPLPLGIRLRTDFRGMAGAIAVFAPHRRLAKSWGSRPSFVHQVNVIQGRARVGAGGDLHVHGARHLLPSSWLARRLVLIQLPNLAHHGIPKVGGELSKVAPIQRIRGAGVRQANDFILNQLLQLGVPIGLESRVSRSTGHRQLVPLLLQAILPLEIRLEK